MENNPTGQRLHFQPIILSRNGNPPGPGAKIYFPHIPQIETGQLVGLICGAGFQSLNGAPVAGNVSATTYIPVGPTNIGGIEVVPVCVNSVGFGFDNLFVTLVNKKGETLFSQIPYSALYPILGKIRQYNAVEIDSRQCYFNIAPTTVLTGEVIAWLGFYMNYQNK